MPFKLSISTISVTVPFKRRGGILTSEREGEMCHLPGGTIVIEYLVFLVVRDQVVTN